MRDFVASAALLTENLHLFLTFLTIYVSYCAYWYYARKQSSRQLPAQWLPLSPYQALFVCVGVGFMSVWAINQYERSDAFIIEKAVKVIHGGIPDVPLTLPESVNQSSVNLPDLIGMMPFDMETVSECLSASLCLIEGGSGIGKSTAIRSMIAGKPGTAFSLQSRSTLQTSTHEGVWCRFAETLDMHNRSNDKSQRLVRLAFERAAIHSPISQSVKPSFYVMIDDIDDATNAELRMLLAWALSQASKGVHTVMISNGGFTERLKHFGGLAKQVTVRSIKQVSEDLVKRHLSDTHMRASVGWLPMKKHDIDRLIDVCGSVPGCLARALAPLSTQWDDQMFSQSLENTRQLYVDQIKQCLVSPQPGFTVVAPEDYNDRLVMADLGQAAISAMIPVEDQQSVTVGVFCDTVREQLLKQMTSDKWSTKRLREGLADVVGQFVQCGVLSFDQSSIRWSNSAIARAARSQPANAFDVMEQARTSLEHSQDTQLHSDL